MPEEQKPIKEERINNPDGTYTVKEVYDKPNFDCYLSDIETFDSANRMLSGSYYEDREFKKLLLTETREYLDYGQYYKFQIREKLQKGGYISCKYLCDNNGKELEAWFYEDKQGTYLLIYLQAEYLENNITKTKNIWYKNDYSNEVYQDDKKRIIKEIMYNDTEFSQLYSQSTYRYSKNGEYTIKTSYEKYDEYGWKSTVEKYDRDNNFLYGECYQDKNFKNLGQKTIRKYYKDGSYKDIKNCKTSSKEPNQVIVKQYTSDDKFISSKYYRDRNFKKLYYTCERKYIAEGHYIDNIVEYNENYKSRIFETNENEKWEKEKYYKNNDFTDLLVSTYQCINTNENIEKQIIYENDQDGWYSTIFEEDEHGRIIRQIWYSDKEFKDIYQDEYWNYQNDNNYTHTTIFHRPLKDNEYHNVEVYDNGKLNKRLFYKDKELTQLYSTFSYEYLSNNKTQRKAVLEEPYKKMFSISEYINKNDKIYYALGYEDKEFKNLYCKSLTKYTKNNYIRLRIYAQKQDGYNTEIEKYNSNNNLIYKKQYNTNFVFARILFWLAR